LLFFYLFPDGRFTPRWTRWLTIGLIVFFVRPLLPGEVSNGLLLLTQLICLPIGVYAQVYRYRRISTAAQRQQTKWAMFGLSAGMIGLLIVICILALFPALYEPGTLSYLVLDLMLYSAVMLPPLGLGIAILRYRLYDIDVIINRTLVYGTLTVALALMYVGSVVLLRQLFAPLTGGSEPAIVISTLMIAALFTPLRRRIQNIIDRRFYRRKYDAAKVLQAFSARLRDETDLDELTTDLLRVVDETMQPTHLSLWLRESGWMRGSGDERRT
jgi:hypothetical protein